MKIFKLFIFLSMLLFARMTFAQTFHVLNVKGTVTHVKTSKDLAVKLNNLPAIRAIAAANGANNFTIIVPCHRVIGAKGEMTGYAGGIANKKKLLELENPALKNELGFDFTP